MSRVVENPKGWLLRVCVVVRAVLWGGLGVLLWGLVFCGVSEAGPWSKGPGKFYVKLSQSFLNTTDSTKPGEPGHPYFSTSTALYGEVGILYGLQVQAFIPYTFATITSKDNASEQYKLNDLGDAIFGLQWTPPFLQKALGFPLALRFNTKVPLYRTKVDEGDGSGIPAGLDGRFPYLGDGQVDYTVWLSAGNGIPKTPLYAYGEVGFRIRSDTFLDPRIRGYGIDFSNTVTFSGQLGWSFFSLNGGPWIAMLNVNGAIPLLKTKSSGSLDGLSKGFVAVGLGLYLKLWKGLAFEANADYMVVSINSDRALSIGVGLSYSY